MANWDIANYYRNLSILIKRISYFDLPIELRTLRELESTLYSKISAGTPLEINAKNITINLEHMISGTTPVNIKAFIISFDHELSIDETKNYLVDDLISKYAFDIQITGFDENAEEYHYAWHLDKNITSSQPKYTHPFYHFQGGGQRLEGMATGEILLIDFPRIPHPPMDLFLGIHFIVNNFISSKDYPKKLELLNDYEYQNVIINSQRLVWDVYFNSFTPGCSHNDFNFKNVFPLYIH